MTKRIRQIVIIAIWIVIWEVAARLIAQPLIFVGPWDTVLSLIRNLSSYVFWKSISFSLLRIGSAFAVAFLLGILLGAVCYKCKLAGEALSPIITLLKSIPVASFVILALVLLGGSKGLTFLVVFVVVMPIVYLNTIAGIGAADSKLLETAKIFRTPFKSRVLYIYRPALYPFVVSAVKVAVGMAFKSGVAAEVIGVPLYSMGERLYNAKIHIETADLFSWTAVIIFLGFVFEKLVLWIVDLLSKGVRE